MSTTIEQLEQHRAWIIVNLTAAQYHNDYCEIEDWKMRKNNIDREIRLAREQLENVLGNCPSVYEGL